MVPESPIDGASGELIAPVGTTGPKGRGLDDPYLTKVRLFTVHFAVENLPYLAHSRNS